MFVILCICFMSTIFGDINIYSTKIGVRKKSDTPIIDNDSQ
ncbi:MAG: hypothetical protein [Bacteriophage sp.]|nr:MAG: hypothetical protein [Bacteriophage sp.]